MHRESVLGYMLQHLCADDFVKCTVPERQLKVVSSEDHDWTPCLPAIVHVFEKVLCPAKRSLIAVQGKYSAAHSAQRQGMAPLTATGIKEPFSRYRRDLPEVNSEHQ